MSKFLVPSNGMPNKRDSTQKEEIAALCVWSIFDFHLGVPSLCVSCIPLISLSKKTSSLAFRHGRLYALRTRHGRRHIRAYSRRSSSHYECLRRLWILLEKEAERRSKNEKGKEKGTSTPHRSA
jgi:hypothetical protein